MHIHQRGSIGLIHRTQADASGMSSAAIGRRVESGRWKKLFPNVYFIAGGAIT
ncbi:MAG: type IV toxin-antitoxin system AbiEi family antitoxin domain-containing protein [Actinomycetota bacterium]